MDASIFREIFIVEILDVMSGRLGKDLVQSPDGKRQGNVSMCSIRKNDYPKDWPEIAKKVKDGAGWRCETCGHAHDPESGYMLTVHHLDGDKSNCSRENLIADCQKCHLRKQGYLKRYGNGKGQILLFEVMQR